ncbi:hypothetical protein ACSLVK_02870 [Photorhabdus tasmaniensis]|uniref:hypothetical protein n=1 Tax=Photorhabdus tasmaniensis TaxID=1004159 RepID=UPI00404123AE
MKNTENIRFQHVETLGKSMPFKIENLRYGEAHLSDFEVSGVEYAKNNLDNNTLFERYPTNNHARMIIIMSAVERLINEHYNAVSPSGYILLAAVMSYIHNKQAEREGTVQYLNEKRNWYVVR